MSKEFHVSFEARIIPIDGMTTIRVPETCGSKEEILAYISGRIREYVEDYHEFEIKLTDVEEQE